MCVDHKSLFAVRVPNAAFVVLYSTNASEFFERPVRIVRESVLRSENRNLCLERDAFPCRIARNTG